MPRTGSCATSTQWSFSTAYAPSAPTTPPAATSTAPTATPVPAVGAAVSALSSSARHVRSGEQPGWSRGA